MGGGMTETVFGASAGNVLTKVTVILAALFLSNTLLLAIITGRSGRGKSLAESLPDAPKTVETSDAEEPLPAGSGDDVETVVPAAGAEAKAAASEAKPGELPSVAIPAADNGDVPVAKPDAKVETPATEAKAPAAAEKADEKTAKPE